MMETKQGTQKNARPSSARPVSARPGNAKPGNAKPGNAKPGNAKPGNARPAAPSRENKSAGYKSGKKPSSHSIRAARLKKMRRRKIRNTVLLILLLVLVVSGTGYLVYSMMGGSFERILVPYQATDEFENSIADKELQRSSPMAEKLCVVTGDVPLESSTLEAEQTGLLLNLDNQQVMFSQGAYSRVYPASITKIITALLAFKYGNMDDTVTVSESALVLEEGSQVCGLAAGDQVTLDQLLHCLLVYSGNDAAAAIAEHIGGSIPAFVDMMNQYALELGCTGTHFSNPHGLQDENHYTTPYDIYLMLNEALNYPRFTEISQLPSYTLVVNRGDGYQYKTVLEATDHYLTGEATPPKNVSILGGKTGTTSNAGNCLALLSQNEYGKPFISIVMGASSKELLYQQMNSLLQNISNA